MDGISLKQKAATFRHHFHYRNRGSLFSILIITACITTGMAIAEMPPRIILFGLIIGALVIAYQLFIFFLTGKNSLLLSKEISIAIIYTTGIWGGPILLMQGDWTGVQIIIMLLFLLLAFSNTTLLSYFDYQNDLQSSQISFSIQYGKKRTSALLKTLLSLSVLVCMGFLLFTQADRIDQYSFIILLMMSILMLTMIFKPHVFQKKNYYKALLESVFLMPALILFV